MGCAAPDTLTDVMEMDPESEAAGTRAPIRRAALVVVVVLLLLYAVVVLLITMSPSPVNTGHEESIDKVVRAVRDRAHQGWFSYAKLELAANVALFLPLGFLLGLALPPRRFWLGVLLLPAFSAGIELMQALFLPKRTASIADVITDGIGGWVGLLGAFATLAMVSAWRRRRAARVDPQP